MKKSGFIDSVRVNEPCSESWEEMKGNEKVRFCSHCAKSVNNLSEMTRKEALRLVRRSKGDLCIRYVRDPSTAAPVFAEQVVQIARRTSRVAAGVMSASMTLAALTFAQGGIGPQRSGSVENRSAESVRAETNEEERSAKGSSSSISGTITDPSGALIPGAAVTLLDGENAEIRSATTNDSGFFQFSNLVAGKYTVSVSAPGFETTRQEGVDAQSKTDLGNISMSVGEYVVLGGVMAIATEEFEGEIAQAVSAEDIDAVKELIARGADINQREEDKTTPLFIAVGNGDIGMVRLLLESGAKVNARNKEKQTPLMQLDEDATPELVRLLIRYGAKVELSDKKRNTALIIAAANSTSEVVQALIDAGAKIDAQNDEGQTALMNAAYEESVEKVKALLEAGADVNLKNLEGDTAWDLAAEEEVEALLVAYGAIIEPVVPDDIEPTLVLAQQPVN